MASYPNTTAPQTGYAVPMPPQYGLPSTELDNALAMLGARMDRAMEGLSRMEQALGPILRPIPPAVATTAPEEDTVTAIRHYAARMNLVCEYIDAISARIDL